MKFILILTLACVGCESQRDKQIRFAHEHNIPIETYDSPSRAWEQKTRVISDESGVPLERVRAAYAAEGRAADLQSIRDHK